MMYGLSKLDKILIQITLLVPIYIFLSTMIIGISALCLIESPSIFYRMRTKLIYRMHFASSYLLLFMLAIQVCFLYANIIPTRQNLTEINDTIMSINLKNNGFPDFIYLKSEGHSKKYRFYSGNEFESTWITSTNLSINTHVRILVEELMSVTDDAYRIWELETDSGVILPFEVMQEARKNDANSENWEYAKFNIGLSLFYFFTLFFKRKADRDIRDKNINQPNDS